jgi:hypothetical protein
MNLTATSDENEVVGSVLIRGLVLTLTRDPYLLTIKGQFFLEHFLRSIFSVLDDVNEHQVCKHSTK